MRALEKTHLIAEVDMKKINHKILSLPPYISTSWKNINTLHMSEIEGKPTLVVVLHNGSTIKIPSLEPAVIEQVFTAHTAFMEREDRQGATPDSLKHHGLGQNGKAPFSFGVPFQIVKEGSAFDHFGPMLHHNPEQSNAPNLPEDILRKIASISKTFGVDLEHANIPKPEPHCNCNYCQIARAIQSKELECNTDPEGEEVSEEDLKFRDWDIQQTSENLYEVTNPIDKTEHYRVFLGSPVGCTCGKKNCEHIRTVLNS